MHSLAYIGVVKLITAQHFYVTIKRDTKKKIKTTQVTEYFSSVSLEGVRLLDAI